MGCCDTIHGYVFWKREREERYSREIGNLIGVMGYVPKFLWENLRHILQFEDFCVAVFVLLLHSGIGDVYLNCGFCDTIRVFVVRKREGRERREVL